MNVSGNTFVPRFRGINLRAEKRLTETSSATMVSALVQWHGSDDGGNTRSVLLRRRHSTETAFWTSQSISNASIKSIVPTEKSANDGSPSKKRRNGMADAEKIEQCLKEFEKQRKYAHSMLSMFIQHYGWMPEFDPIVDAIKEYFGSIEKL
jgi:hypothetical protein